MAHFDGFVAADFSDTIAGTTWRRRDQLGGLLAKSMTQTMGERYQSWGVRRKLMLFVAPVNHFGGSADAEKGLPRGKLFVGTGNVGLTYGFYIEKGYTDVRPGRASREQMDDKWDWHTFVQVIQTPKVSEVIRRLVMHQDYLWGDDQNPVGIYRTSPDGQLHQLQSRTLVLTPKIAIWEDVIRQVTADLPSEWINLYLMRHLSPEQAVQRGAAITDDIAQSFEELSPIFEASRGKQAPSQTISPASQEPPTADLSVGSSDMIERIAQHIRTASTLHFRPSQLATFITALQTKGFVILSGISGTGKTKLAQEFARLMQAEDEESNTLFLSVRPDWRDNKSLLGYYNPLTEQYQTTELLRFILRARQDRKTPSLPGLAQWLRKRLQAADTQGWLAKYRQLRQRLQNRAPGDFAPEDLEIIWKHRDNGISGIGPASSAPLDGSRLMAATEIAMDNSRSPAQRYYDVVQELGGHGVANQKRHWARAWRAVTAFDPEHMHTIVQGPTVAKLLEHLDYDNPMIPRELALRKQIGEIDRATQFLFEKVDQLLPHADVLERSITPWLMWEYFEGNVVETVSPDVPPSPYFIFFDEMNLARVEYYFAEFLSVLEGGREKDGFTREAIRLHEFERPINDPEGNLVPSAISLPPNLFFVGTVNVDETTHMFSPKVLDRAFTLEFATADLSGYLAESGLEKGTLSEDERFRLRSHFTRGGRFAQVDKSRIHDFHTRHPNYMEQLRGLEIRLQPHGLHFGYRIVDEVLMFLANAEEYEWYDSLGGLPNAFDQAVTMKILPKFHGPRSRLEEPIWSVLEWAGISSSIRQEIHTAMASGTALSLAALTSAADATSAPIVARKCTQMLSSLYSTGFAAFS